MNKKRSIDFILIIFILGLLLIFGGCSKSPERRKTWTTTSDSLPKKPTQGQIFRDRDNNSWAYNAALGAWVLGSGGYRYYPEILLEKFKAKNLSPEHIQIFAKKNQFKLLKYMRYKWIEKNGLEIMDPKD